MKKRLLSALLAFCVLSGTFPVFAGAAEEEGAGELSLTINRQAAVAATGFEGSLKGENGESYPLSLYMEKGATSATVSLGNIRDGMYILELSAEQYLDYTQQQLEFKGDCVNLTLYNYESVNYNQPKDRLFGVMPVGDLNSDGKIDDSDANIIRDNIEGDAAKYDLNGDGLVDIKDLSIVVRNKADSVQPAKPVHTVSSYVLKDKVTMAAETGSVQSGTVESLLNQHEEGTKVGLAPAKDEAISEENPVAVSMDVAGELGTPEEIEKHEVKASAVEIIPPPDSENRITAGTVEVYGIDIDTKTETTITCPFADTSSHDAAVEENGGEQKTYSAALMRAGTNEPEFTVESNGTIVINLGKRVAIKKVTITATATKGKGKLAEIAKVEFLSNFAERISEPQLSIPTIDKSKVSNTESDGLGYKTLTVGWSHEDNVTGYEVQVTGPGYNKTAYTTENTYAFIGDSFNGTVLSFKEYTIKARSVSGDWRSNWSEPYKYTVTCNNAPPAPQYLNVVPGVQTLNVSWNCKFDAESFTLYYKKASDSTFTEIENITSTSYVLRGLEGGTKYTVYVVAHNRNGASPKSDNAEGMPTTGYEVNMPKYKLINTVDENGTAMTHIESITSGWHNGYTICKPDGTLVTGDSIKNSEAEKNEAWKSIADNNPSSYLLIPDWDSGVSYNNFRGPVITLDQKYKMNTICITPFSGTKVSMYDAAVEYKDENDTIQRVEAGLYSRYDSQNRLYYEIILDKPIETDYLALRTRTYNARDYTIAEVSLYNYDDLEEQVTNLFVDKSHTVLKEDVTLEDIEKLETRANTIDTVSNEYHPHKYTILNELKYAKEVFNDPSKTAKGIMVDNQITANKQPASGFAQVLSDYQPLGYAAAAGETVSIYVSDLDGYASRGNNVNLNLVAAQYHPEVANWQSSAIRLKAGRNDITIPKIGSYAQESGGSLYLQYTGTKGGNHYQVRVIGGARIPVLNLDGVTGNERGSAIQAYVTELEDYVSNLESNHTELHQNSSNKNINSYAYDEKKCILNSTEITMENMMFSLPAKKVLEGLGSGDKAQRLESAIEAMEQEIDYFYQFKGLNKEAKDNDAYPFTRLNIRYHQMFTGAFMYAGGKHIGIEYGSVAGLFGTNPVLTDENGKKTDGQYSGWGIAHEIGHCINAAAYQRVEVTNNVFAQLAQTDETNGSFRTTYDKVYKAVATGTTGHTGDLAVQLAMYWQLHLAYDNDYTYKVYDSIESQQKGLFYARLESYLRDRTKPEHDIPSSSSGDQLFMQAACAAANKNVLDFFIAWGFYPDTTTVAYAGNYEVEKRKIQYIDDDSRLYRIEKKSGMSEGTVVYASIDNAKDSRINDKIVNLSFSIEGNENNDALLGYEIKRNGKAVAFVPASESSYTDIVTTENNKAFVYTVTGIDKLLNETEECVLDEVKVCHEGMIDKTGWSAETNASSESDKLVEPDVNDPDGGSVDSSGNKPNQVIESAIKNAIDDNATEYLGTTTDEEPYVILNLGGNEQVTALKFTPAEGKYLGGYKIEVSSDGANWETVKEGVCCSGVGTKHDSDIIGGNDGPYTMYFNKQLSDGKMDPFMYTYDAAFVKLTFKDTNELAVSELDILGPTNDNVELLPEGFGRLTEAFQYDADPKHVIPADSIIFYGSYRGDPAYNAVMLRDQAGNILTGHQIFTAEVPEQGALGQTSDGRWIYWLEDETQKSQLTGLKKVQTELYRVQNAETLEGQRLTSTSLHMAIPETINDIVLTSEAGKEAYIPEEALVEAMEDYLENSEAAAEFEAAPIYEGYFADTGASETTEPASPVHLAAGNDGSVSYEVKPGNISIASQAEIRLSPAPADVDVKSNVSGGTDENYYYCSRYIQDAENPGTMKLELYMVARKGSIGETSLSGTFSKLENGAKATASALKDLYSTYEINTTELTNSVDIKTEEDPDTGDEPGGDTGDEPGGDTGDEPGGDTGDEPGGDTGDEPGGDTGNEPGDEPGGSTGGSSGGGGGAGGSGSAGVTQNGGTSELQPSASVNSSTGEAKAQIAENDINAAVKKAKDESSDEIIINPKIQGEASGVTVSVPVAGAAKIASEAGAKLTVKNDIATVTIPKAGLEALGKMSGNNVTVSALKSKDDPEKLEISVGIDGKNISSLDLSVAVPVKDAAPGTVLVIVSPDGTETPVKKSALEGGTLTAIIGGSCTVKAKDKAIAFNDVDDSFWGKDAVDFASSHELMSGTRESTFSPNEPMSRAMLSVVLYRLEDAKAEGENHFSDVEPGKWYTDAVIWANNEGIVTGYGSGRFGSNDNISREQLAAMLYRYAKTVGMDVSSSNGSAVSAFGDSGKISSWANDAMSWAVFNGIITGKTNTSLNPADNTSRAEVAVMLQRLISKMVK